MHTVTSKLRMHEAERVNATRIKQPFGRVQALVSTAKELGEGPTQTGSTSLRPKALEEPEEMEAFLEVDTPLSGLVKGRIWVSVP